MRTPPCLLLYCDYCGGSNLWGLDWIKGATPILLITCDGNQCPGNNMELPANDKVDLELQKRGWTFYGNMDWCPDCKEYEEKERTI